MKLQNILIYFNISIFFILLSSSLKAEIKLNDFVPSQFHGVWSEDCEIQEFTWRIDEYTSLEITENNFYLDFLKTNQINTYTVSKYHQEWEPGKPWYFFMKIENEKLVYKDMPSEWNEKDFSFLLDSTYDDTTVFEKCELGIKNEYKIILNTLLEILDSDIIKICSESNFQNINCYKSFFNFFDINRDRELTIAELSFFSKFLINFIYLNGNINADYNESLMQDNFLIINGTSFVFAPYFSQLLVLNYDFDNSNSLSIDEILNENSEIITSITLLLNSDINSLQDLLTKFNNIL